MPLTTHFEHLNFTANFLQQPSNVKIDRLNSTLGEELESSSAKISTPLPMRSKGY